MIPLDRALAMILERVPRLGSEVVPLGEAAGRVLAAEVVAPRPVPPHDNAALDGVAFRAADVRAASAEAPARLRVIAEVAAGGRAGRPVQAGEAVRIMTGAPLPEGVDSVLGIEDVLLTGGEVAIAGPVRAGANVRRAGEDLAVGDVPVVRGTRLGPAALGVLASMGLDRVDVARRPRVALLATGNELLPVGAPWREGAIYSSNTIALAAYVNDAGGVPIDRGLVGDDLAATMTALDEALEADVVITSGGVSMGEYDHVRTAAPRVGVLQVFWRVAIKPGKPFYFGQRGSTPLFALPGNPASALLVFEELVRPALLAMQGANRVVAPLIEAVLDAPYRQRPGRLGLVRCALAMRGGVAYVTPQEGQGSGILSSLATAEAVMRVPPEIAELSAGARVLVRLQGWKESS